MIPHMIRRLGSFLSGNFDTCINVPKVECETCIFSCAFLVLFVGLLVSMYHMILKLICILYRLTFRDVLKLSCLVLEVPGGGVWFTSM